MVKVISIIISSVVAAAAILGVIFFSAKRNKHQLDGN